jgi:hypothetical protein
MKNGHKRTQRDHPTNSEVQRIEKDIRALRDSGKSDIEIRETLKTEERTYRRYIRKIHLEDERVWFSITQEQLGSELLRLKSSLEETYRISLAMAKDHEYGDRLGALASMNDSRLSIVHLLVEYPDFIKKIPQPEDEAPSVKNIPLGRAIKPSTFKRLHS